MHDQATVTGAPGDADGDGDVRWFTNGTCTGTPAATSAPFTLAGGAVDGDDVHADAERVGEFRVPGDLFG